MKTILSIQSHVAYGYVGNRSAVFPLQCMGFDVSAIHTVQFSNHTGYGSWTGEVFSDQHIRSIIDGLRDRGVLGRFDALLSGYLGDARIGHIVLDALSEIRKTNPNCIYCCDPVMGDVGCGLFVRPDIPDFFRDHAMMLSDILTPNVFELETLSGMNVQSSDDVRTACRFLHERGAKIVLVTSIVEEDNHISMIASHNDGPAWKITTPMIQLDPSPNGTGDLTSALFLGHILSNKSVADALAHTTKSVFAVLKATALHGGRELALIAARNDLTLAAQPPKTATDFKVKELV